MVLRVRWLGRVRYGEALDLQRRLAQACADNYLLLLEHNDVYTAGNSADLANLLVSPAAVGADFHRTERGGDLTYHGPGQLTGYPILSLPGRRGGGLAETAAYVRLLEQLLIDTLADVGLPGCGRLERYPGVWVHPAGGLVGGSAGGAAGGSVDATGAATSGPRKIAAIGVRIRRGRTLHGFALNVSTDLSWYEHIVPCGITEFGVTSLAQQGVDVSMAEVVDALVARAAQAFESLLPDQPAPVQPAPGQPHPGQIATERMDVVTPLGQDLAAVDLSVFSGRTQASPLTAQPVAYPSVAGRTQASPHSAQSVADTKPSRSHIRLANAGVTNGLALTQRKPSWLKARMDLNAGYRRLRSVMERNDLVTVCEEAGCPNIYECWGAGTATFMINGADCTRACGFCLVGTAKPQPLDPGEPLRVAHAVSEMGLSHAVITAVARDDLADGGAAAFAATIAAIRAQTASATASGTAAASPTTIEVLIPDFGGDATALQTVIAAAPDVANHNIETVPRLQRAVRPSASYARSLAVLARLAAAGLTTKSGLIVGLGETDDEVDATLGDLAAIGTKIVTIGQYLRPTQHHVPVARWVEPAAFDRWAELGERLGIAHVQASPLTRSSYHAHDSYQAQVSTVGVAVGSAGAAVSTLISVGSGS